MYASWYFWGTGHQHLWCYLPSARRPGYGSRFCRSFCHALQKAALTSSHQWKYQQDKHVDARKNGGWYKHASSSQFFFGMSLSVAASANAKFLTAPRRAHYASEAWSYRRIISKFIDYAPHEYLIIQIFRHSVTLLKTETPMVGYLDTYRFDPYCGTALGVQRDVVKKPITCIKAYTATCWDCWHNWPAVYTVSTCSTCLFSG